MFKSAQTSYLYKNVQHESKLKIVIIYCYNILFPYVTDRVSCALYLLALVLKEMYQLFHLSYARL